MADVKIPHIALSGIYKITCEPTEEFYIGLSVDIFNRWAAHYTNAFMGKHSSKKLEEAMKKYGLKEFTFEILEVVSKTEHRAKAKAYRENFDDYFRRVLLEREAHWMSLHSITFALNADSKHFS